MSHSTVLNSTSELETPILNKTIILYCGPDNKDFQTFLHVTDSLIDFKILHTFDQKLKEDLKAAKVMVYKNFDEKNNRFEGFMDKK
jgi:hypothetical protein